MVHDSGIVATMLQTCVSNLKFSLKIMVNKMYREIRCQSLLGIKGLRETDTE